MGLVSTPWWAWVALAVSLGVAVLGWWLWWRDPGAGGRRCGACWYDMRGVKGLRCPECGVVAADERALSRRRRGWILGGVLWVAAVLVLLPTVRTRLWATLYYKVMPRWTLVAASPAGLCEVREYRVRDPADVGERVVVRQGSRVVVEVEDYRVWRGVPRGTQVTSVPAALRLGLGNDGERLIIESFSGGAHCCTGYVVVRVDRDPAVEARIDAGNGAYWRVRPDGKGLEMVGADYTFDYWRAPHVASPAPGIVLRWDGTRMALAREAMVMRRDEAQALANTAAVELRAMPAWQFDTAKPGPPPALWGRMLDLAYGGHEDLAWGLMREAWQAGWGEAGEFREAFEAQWKLSPYYEEVRSGW